MRWKLARFCIWLWLVQNFVDFTAATQSSSSLPYTEDSLVSILISDVQSSTPKKPGFEVVSGKYEKVSLSRAFSTGISTSLIAACKDRLLQLEQVFHSWLSIYGLSQLILVDWTSTEPLLNFVLDAVPRKLNNLQVVVIRVDNATNWNLAQAYNLAASFATEDWILKADCDTWVDPWFLYRHPHQVDTFYSASKATEKYLHGVFYMPRKIFYQVGGFDERIHSYGWEDDSLLERVVKYLYLEPVQSSTIQHIPHEDTLRQKYQSCLLGTICLPELEVQFNRILFKFLPCWNIDAAHSEYLLVEHDISNRNCCSIRLQPKKLVPMPSISPSYVKVAKIKAIRIILATKYHFPRNSIREWPLSLLESVIRQLVTRRYFLLIISSYNRRQRALMEKLSTTNHDRLIVFITSTSLQLRQAVQEGVPALYRNDTKFTNLFQNPQGSHCLPYQVLSKRSLYLLSENKSLFPGDHHWIFVEHSLSTSLK